MTKSFGKSPTKAIIFIGTQGRYLGVKNTFKAVFMDHKYTTAALSILTRNSTILETTYNFSMFETTFMVSDRKITKFKTVILFFQDPGSWDSLTKGFLTLDSFHSTSLATWGLSWASREAKFIKEFDYLCFSCCFWQNCAIFKKKSKIQSNCVILYGFSSLFISK